MAKRKKSGRKGGGLWWILLIIVLLGGGYYWYESSHTIKAQFSCTGGKTLSVQFRNGFSKSAKLSLSDGRNLSLAETASAGGARYANSDESIVFWNVGEGARLQEGQNETFSGCQQN